MKPIKLPFGLNKENVLVHVSDVESGKKCGCICPDCRSPLIACKGKVKQPHFKHEVEKECNGESSIHLAAKKLLLKKKTNKTTSLHCYSLHTRFKWKNICRETSNYCRGRKNY